MNLAVLAGNDAIFPILEALRDCDRHRLVSIWCDDDDALRSEISARHPDIVWARSDGEIPSGQDVDAVIAAGTSQTMLAQVRYCTQLRLPIFIVVETPAPIARLFDYMEIWQDVPTLISPLFTSGLQAVSREALNAWRQLSTAQPWKIEFTRSISKTAETPVLTFEQADRALLQDLEWFVQLYGHPTQVQMLAAGAESDRPAEVSVLLRGDDVPEFRWQLQMHSGPPRWTLAFTGESDRLVVECENDHLPLVEAEGWQRPLAIENTRHGDLLKQLDESATALATGQPLRPWLDFVQLAEVGAAARRSLTRRRMVDIHLEETSERSQFKTQMTALGCGVLLWTLFGAIAVLILGGIADPRDREYRAASAAGFVLNDDDFQPGRHGLTDDGQGQLTTIAATWSSTSPVLVVAAADDEQANLARRETVVAFLRDAGVRAPESRVVVRALPGYWFETLMIGAWIVVFAPLGLVLLAQLLIVAARPVASD